MGHGAFKDDVGALVFETPEKRTDLVTGQELMRLLQPGIPPAVVILNACNTGTAEGGPFSGVAASLVKSGLLAVVAMQFPITDWAALVFSSTLYRHLAQGDPVDTAVSEGRHAILLDDPNSTEWSTPVLFLRTPNGHVLEPSRVSVQEKEEAVWLLEDLTEIDLDQLLAALEPGVTSPDRTTRVRQRLTVAARRGGEDWLKFLESLLAVRSPVSIFDGSLRHWRASTEGLWRPEGEELLGEGEDFPIFSEPPGLEEASLLTWEGLPFRDGTLASRVSMPFPGWGGACGLGMRCTPQVAVFGLLRDLPSAPSLELWQKQGDRLVPVGDSVPLPKKPGGLFDLSLRLEGRDVTLYCGSIELKAQLAVDLHAGFAGVIKFAGTSVYLSSLILEVPLCATPIGGNP